MIRARLLCVVILCGCGNSNSVTPAGDGGADPQPTVDIQWGPDTTYIDAAHTALVTAYDPATAQATVDAAGAQAAALDLSVGRVLVIHGQALGRITDATPQGSALVLTLGDAALDEAIADGDIQWQQTIDFDPSHAGMAETGQSLWPEDLTVNGNMVSYKQKVGDFSIAVTLAMKGASADLTMKITKDLATGLVGTFTVTGQLQKFVAQSAIQIHGGKLSSFSHLHRAVQGDLKLNLAVAGSLDDALDFSIPVPLGVYAALIGPIPVLVTVGAKIVIMGHVPIDGSAQVETSFTFNSDLGFKYNGTTVDATANIGPYMITPSGVMHTAASSPISANFGIGFPEVSVNLFGKSVVGAIDPAFLVSGSYTFMPACQTADADFLASAAYSLGVLGFNLAKGSVLLFEQKKPLLRSGACPP